jgi:hypothetical protein
VAVFDVRREEEKTDSRSFATEVTESTELFD